MCQKNAPEVYHPREPEKSPFFQLVSRYFNDFERIYPAKYQKTYGFSSSCAFSAFLEARRAIYVSLLGWRPVIRRSIDKFKKCGDLHEGFARVKCTIFLSAKVLLPILSSE